MIQFRASKITGVAFGLALSICISPAHAYNSEEHKAMGDWGASEVRLDTSITLPFPTRFATFPTSNYLASYQAAKNLAVGFATNNQANFSNQKKKVQDNSYPPSIVNGAYDQLDGCGPFGCGSGPKHGNLDLWIPDPGLLRENGLFVLGFAESAGRTFTFGDLMALYGDYRRTPSCRNAGEECFLTNAATNTISFQKGWDCYLLGKGVGDGTFGADCGWRPNPLSSTGYLRDIAAGLWPPYGTLGDTLKNTADNPTDYFEAGWWGDEMLRIAETNDWHFSDVAVAWYIGLHRLALRFVDLARTNPTYWNAALHYEANALHSLTDLFAFGHVVTSRDETSYALISGDGIFNSDVRNTPTYRWMEQALQEGGALRNSNGRVTLSSNLPAITDSGAPRDATLLTYISGSSWMLYGKTEHDYHTRFNNGGAVVRNLRGDSIQIFGDAKLRNTASGTREIIKEAVRVSLRSLFDAYVKLERYGETVEQIGAAGSDYFAALRYIPVFVQSDSGNNFTGRWTRYAQPIDTITGANVVRGAASNCVMPYINGGSSLPAPSATPCTSFPTVAANDPPAAPLLVAPGDGQTGVGVSQEFRWTVSEDPEGGAVRYDLVVCDDPAFPANCGISFVMPSAGAASASGAGLVLFAALFGVGATRRRKRAPALLIAAFAALTLGSCGDGAGGGAAPEVAFTRTDLQPATTYHWKVLAYDGEGGSSESAVRSFVTQ